MRRGSASFGSLFLIGLLSLGAATIGTSHSAIAQEAPIADEAAASDQAPPVAETTDEGNAATENATTENAATENATAESGEEPGPGQDAASPARATWDALFTEWKALLKDLRDTKSSYQLADEAQLGALRDQWDEGLTKGESMVPQLREAALAAYLEAPNEDRDLTRFLMKLAADLIREDNYAPAKSMLLALQESGCDERGIDNLIGIAAVGTNGFELAEQYLTEAQRNGTLSEQGEKLYAGLGEMVDGWKRESELRKEQAAADEKLPRVLLETTAGDITIELFENEAPETVGNFISLVEKGFYDGLTFHRVLEGFMAQAGCPKGDGSGGPGYRVYCECINDDHRDHFAGSLSMAKETARHTGGSQFFMNLVPTPHLNGQHTVFGYVVEGLDVLPKIAKIDPGARRAQDEPTTITRATVLNKRDHEYRPNKVK